MTLILSWWQICTIITVVSYIPVGIYSYNSRNSGPFDFGPALVGLAWIIFSLIVWLIGALCK